MVGSAIPLIQKIPNGMQKKMVKMDEKKNKPMLKTVNVD
jgi:hypothetical protein